MRRDSGSTVWSLAKAFRVDIVRNSRPYFLMSVGLPERSPYTRSSENRLALRFFTRGMEADSHRALAKATAFISILVHLYSIRQRSEEQLYNGRSEKYFVYIDFINQWL